MDRLFTPWRIGALTIPNRIVLPPMVCFGFAAADGFVSERNIDHYARRARGGAGLIIVEATAITPQGRLSPLQLGLWSDDQIEGMASIAEVCHKQGAQVLVQLHHAGMLVQPDVSPEPIAPSAAGCARAMTIKEIQDVRQAFISAALRAKQAGFDGVELHGAHRYLLSQMFSPGINRREDDYGGCLENRTRLATEIIGDLRSLWPQGILQVRMGCDEPTLSESILLAQRLEKAGAQCLHISTGLGVVQPGQRAPLPEAPEEFPFNGIVYGGVCIRKQVGIPVIAVNGIRVPEQARLLADTTPIDGIAIGRAFLADCHWGIRARDHVPVEACLNCHPCAYFKADRVCPIEQKRQSLA